MLSLLIWNGVQQLQASLVDQARLWMRQLAISLRAPLMTEIALDNRAALLELVEESQAIADLSRVAVYSRTGDTLALSEAADVVEHFASGDQPFLMIDDPLVLLANLMDGLGLPMADVPHAPMPELAAVYDFAPDGLHLQDLWVHDPHA